MTKTIQIKTYTTEEITVNAEQVMEDIHVYRRVSNKTISYDRESNHSEVELIKQGLVNLKGLEEIEKGVDPVSVPGLKNTFISTDEDLENFRLLPWSDAVKKCDFKNRAFTAYDDFKAGKWSADNLLFIDGNTHSLRTAAGDLLPLAQCVDYYSGLDTHNGNWDLEGLVEHLKARDDICFHAKGGEEYIDHIPYYNEEPGKTRFVGFIWQPSKEDFLRVHEKALELDRRDSGRMFQRAMFETDILGLKAAGLNLYEDFYGEVPRSYQFNS